MHLVESIHLSVLFRRQESKMFDEHIRNYLFPYVEIYWVSFIGHDITPLVIVDSLIDYNVISSTKKLFKKRIITRLVNKNNKLLEILIEKMIL